MSSIHAIGWFQFDRQTWQKAFAKRPIYLAIWTYILSKATYNDTQICFKGDYISLKKNQSVFTQREIADYFGISVSTVNTAIKIFATEHLIERTATKKYTIITVLKKEKKAENKEVPNISRTRYYKEEYNKKNINKDTCSFGLDNNNSDREIFDSLSPEEHEELRQYVIEYGTEKDKKHINFSKLIYLHDWLAMKATKDKWKNKKGKNLERLSIVRKNSNKYMYNIQEIIPNVMGKYIYNINNKEYVASVPF